MSHSIQKIQDKVYSGQRINADECLTLFDCKDLITLGQMAHHVRRKKNGLRAYYNINRHINYSNICYTQCKFCEFGQPKSSEKAYQLSLEEIKKLATQAVAEGATEFHIVGGLHPDLKLGYYENLLSELKIIAPGVHLKAFTAVEIDYFSKISGLSLQEVLIRLQKVGLDSLPGGGAEVMTDRVHRLLCPDKINGQRWLEVHRTAHSLGIRSNATMLYGHIETKEEKVEHLQKLRDLQDETGGFMTFIPLSFVPDDTEMRDILPATGFSDLRHIAIARIFLDNFDHIKVYWVMTGIKLAQLALHFGADDIDGTVMQEKIVHMAGATTPEGVQEFDLVRLIQEAKLQPVQRDTLYRVL